MRLCNRSVLAAAVVVGTLGSFGLVRAGTSGNGLGIGAVDGMGVAQLADEHWKYPHMHHAMASLKEARKDLDGAEDVFHGHKQDAIDHVEKAIKSIQDGLKEKDDAAALPAEMPRRIELAEKYPKLKHALDRLKTAKDELEASEKIFGGHRDEAISHTDKAIKQIDDGIRDAG